MQALNELIEYYIQKEKLPASYLDVALKWFIPLCESINTHHDESVQGCKLNTTPSPFFIGVNGCQGSGKSTLSGLLSYLLNHYYAKKSIVLSLDDFYLSKQERNQLAKKVHPLLATRGVPGTHDTNLIASVFKALSMGNDVDIPVFDKSIDDRASQAHWQDIRANVDIVIMEGWCWGTQAETAAALIKPINDFEATHDSDGTWRRFVNKQLAKDYMPLYSQMDQWIFLKAPSFASVYAWRLQQERKLAVVCAGSHLMSDAEVLTFIQYYQRLTVHTLCTLEGHANWIFELDDARNIIKSRHNA